MPDELLTKSRKKQVERNRTKVIKGTPLNYNAASEERYSKKLISLVRQMTAQTAREVEKLFKEEHVKEFFGQDRSVTAQARIVTNSLKKKFDQLFASKANGLAMGMINDADKTSSANLHASLKELSGGLSLKTTAITAPMKQIISASLIENVSLIKSIPAQYHNQIQGAVMRSITTGNGLQDLVPALKKYENITMRRARLIAQDQTKKVYTNLNAGRMKAIGVDEYEWVHSSGALEPRELHLSYSGRIFSLDDPPIIQYAKGSLPEVYGKPGDLINCGCKMRPVIKFDEG